ncbi:MAG: thioredoxin domain-containing protein [Acidobacteriia bacterium]|nr:thioredoxin domain-containing protein [Terriglobia bacterium]
MFRSLFGCVVALLCLSQAGPAQNKSALDKATMEAYVRHLFVMDSRVTVQVSDPKPSDLPGFSQVIVSASMPNAHQDFEFLVSKDGSKIVQGTVFNAAENPFKKELDKLKTEGAPSFGTQGAPVVIVEFSDFECPYCQREAKVIRENLLSTYPTQVHFYFKEFPLTSLHPWALAAAATSRCVYNQNHDEFWKYHDWIFDHQNDIMPENFKDKVQDWAKGEKSIDSLKLAACMENKSGEAEVEKDVAEGHALGVDSTPTLFINGRKLASAADWQTLRAIIDFEIEYQKTAKNAGEDCGCTVKLNLPVGQQAPQPGELLNSSKR